MFYALLIFLLVFLLASLLIGTSIALLARQKTPLSGPAKFFRLPMDAIQTLLGMSAKFACSAHHISGFTTQRIRNDLRNYSPLFSLVTIHQDKNQTSAKLANLITVNAHFHPRQGCTLRGAEVSGSDLPRPTPSAPFIPTNCSANRKNHRCIDPTLQRLVESQIAHDSECGLDTRALVVLQGDEVLAEAYGKGIRADTRLLGWSMTKSLLAMLYGRMETLGLADPTCNNLFPEWSSDARSEITLQHLLQMCDGLAFDETYRPGADATRMLFGPLPASRYALMQPLRYAPGTHFSYSSGSTNLLARWMHHRLGGSEKALAFWRDEFVAPLGLANPILEVDGDGVFIGSSYGYAPATDWGRLGSVFLSEGKIADSAEPLLDASWIERAVQPNASDNDPRYGYQLWLNNRSNQLAQLYPRLPASSFYMLGNREQKLMVAPSHNAVVVRLGWSASPYPIEDRFGEILQSLPG